MLDFELVLEMKTTAGINATGTCVSSPSVISTHSRDKETSPNHMCWQRAWRRRDDRNNCPALLGTGDQNPPLISMKTGFFFSGATSFLYGHHNPLSAFCWGDNSCAILFASTSLATSACIYSSSGSSRNKFLGACSSTLLSQKPWLKSTITLWWIPLP